MSQAQLQRARVVVPAFSAAPQQPPPFGGASDEPQFVMSPQAAATGHKTTGIVFMVACDAVTFVQVYARDPHTRFWGLVAEFNNAAPGAIAPFKWASVCDLLASELWFSTDASNSFGRPFGPMILVEETSG